MLPPFSCCDSAEARTSSMHRHQQRKMAMLNFWRDGLERQLAAINASISTLQQQIDRDASQA
jgi:hypothetical protein